MVSISSQEADSLKAKIDGVTQEKDGLPGVVFCAVNKDGELIFNHASGKIGLGQEEDMTSDAVFWIASCTKMITGIAAMQLVEQGKLALDDVELVEKLAPELKAVKVLQSDGQLVAKNRGITLRMLLSHTAGFGYSCFNQKIIDYNMPAGIDDLGSGLPEDYLTQPLVNQPGERWEYGINVDWAGQLVERVTGLSLNDYFIQNIFTPIGVKYISMFPTAEMKKSVAYMHSRSPEGKVSLNLEGHPNRRPLKVTDPRQIKDIFNPGGSGCFARLTDYCQVIATLLNDGTHPGTGATILKPETIKQMFANQIPEMPNFGRQLWGNPKPWLTNALPELYPQSHDLEQGWGLTFFLRIHQGPSGSAPGTGHWAGLPNLFWWADRETGLGGIIGTQIIPFGDMKVLGLWGEIEAGLYNAVRASGAGKS